jgi:hypothetical protein
MNDLAGLVKDTSVLTLRNRVSLSALTTIGSLKAGSVKDRARDTLRAVVQGVAPTRAGAPPMPDGVPMRDGAYRGGIPHTRGPASKADQEMLRIMPRGAERC